MREPFLDKLQKDTEHLTEQLEQVKREEKSLDDEIAQLERQLNQFANLSAQPNPQLQHKIKQLEILVQQEQRAANEEIEQNIGLRRQIDVYRLEQTHYRKNIDELQAKLQRVNRQARVKNVEIKTSKSVEEHNKDLLLRLSRKRLSTHQEYSAQMFKLNSFLREERHSRLLNNRKFSLGFENRLKQPTEIPQLSRPLEKLLAKWSVKLADQKRYLDSYTAEIQRLRTAFEHLSKATGVSSIDDIVIALIKADQQQFDIAELANKLDSEADLLEHSTEQMNFVIADPTTVSEVNAYTQQLVSLKGRLTTLMGKVEGDTLKIHNVAASFQKSAASLFKLHELLTNLFKFRQFRVQTPGECDHDTLLLVMADIEECIGGVLVTRSFNENDPAPFLKTLPLSSMNTRRRFNEKLGIKPIAIDDEFIKDLDDKNEVVTYQEFKTRAIQFTNQNQPKFHRRTSRTPTYKLV